MKLTRKSYKRKIIAIGVAMFVSLALIATGFASWVLATAGQKEAEGNVTIGTTTEKAIEISEITFADGQDDFIFEPKEGDYDGRVRYDGENAENLTVKFTCTVKSASFVKELTIRFDTLPQGIQDAVTAGYIIAPDFNKVINMGDALVPKYDGTIALGDDDAAGGSYVYEKVDATEGEDVYQLNVTLNFGWGEKFGFTNPSEYFDTDEVRESVSTSEVRDELDTFKATIHEMTLEEYRAQCFDPETNEPIDSAIEALAPVKYKIIIEATA